MEENTDYYENEIIKLIKEIKNPKTKEMLYFLIKKIHKTEE